MKLKKAACCYAHIAPKAACTIKKVTALFMVLMLLCGCSGGEISDKNKKGKNGGIIKLQMGITDSFNPLTNEKQSVRDALSLCYEPLFRLNNEMMPEGVLAKSCKISDDGMSAIISLKESVKWHDEKLFTAGDVVYTINKIKEADFSVYSSLVAPIETAEAIDASAVRLTFNRPYARIAYSLYFPIVPSHAKALESKITGTGPYMMEDYVTQSVLNLTSFDLWHLGEVKCKKAEVYVIRDKTTAETALNTGVINAVTGESIDLSNYALKSGERSARCPSSSYEFMAFNNNAGIFSSRQMRTAVSMAIDRGSILNEVYGGFASAANPPLHPEASAAPPSAAFSEYNKEAALETFFYEGYSVNGETGRLTNEKGEGISFSILVNEDNSSRISCAQLMATQLGQLGIDVSVQIEKFDEYLKLIEKRSFDAYIGGTRLSNIYDYEFLFSPEGSLNNYGYSSEEMQAALLEIATAPTDDSLQNAVKNFEEVFMREQPISGIAYLSDMLIAADSVRGSLLPCPGFPYAGISGWSIKKEG